jgi:hypothetical protein
LEFGNQSFLYIFLGVSEEILFKSLEENGQKIPKSLHMNFISSASVYPKPDI